MSGREYMLVQQRTVVTNFDQAGLKIRQAQLITGAVQDGVHRRSRAVCKHYSVVFQPCNAGPHRNPACLDGGKQAGAGRHARARRVERLQRQVSVVQPALTIQREQPPVKESPLQPDRQLPAGLPGGQTAVCPHSAARSMPRAPSRVSPAGPRR